MAAAGRDQQGPLRVRGTELTAPAYGFIGSYTPQGGTMKVHSVPALIPSSGEVNELCVTRQIDRWPDHSTLADFDGRIRVSE